MKLSLLLLLLVNVLPAIFAEKTGRCPRERVDTDVCPEDGRDQCNTDTDCSGEGKCCSTGCNKVCVLPLYNVCDQQKKAVEKRARMLSDVGDGDSNLLSPSCTNDGSFQEIQCNDAMGMCWCVDQAGFERAGTRARAFDLINCSNPNPCAGFRCRMLCEFDFELDSDGCPLCQCRDPCSGVRCPGGLRCQLEDVPCLDEPCPPVPTCKQARSLSSLCPVGEPLTMDVAKKKPFLCGTGRGKPPCPPLHKCSVQPGHEYGVCCPATDQFRKAGSCPAVPGEEGSCGEPCDVDLQCAGRQKCCNSDTCGKHCQQPINTTACLQQKMLSELLMVNEKEGKGYLPQCGADGEFEPRQCSRNGLVCWCVEKGAGTKITGSMGPADEVVCQHSDLNAAARISCPDEECAHVCEYGYISDETGCPTCRCDDPCDGYTCPPQHTCITVTSHDDCNSFLCPTFPQCHPQSLLENPCEGATPLFDPLDGEVVICSPPGGCPASHQCVPMERERKAVCCPRGISVELTKPGTCPILSLHSCNISSCMSDMDCKGGMKCCTVEGCSSVCADPLVAPTGVFFHDAGFLPTMCEYLHDFHKMNSESPLPVLVAVPEPVCDDDGSFQPMQCDPDTDECWCVDVFGVEVKDTRSRSTDLSCSEQRDSIECLDLVCRLGCDFGFIHDPVTRCPLCECRNPCDSAHCPDGHYCDLVDVDCGYEMCPPIPQCLPTQRSVDVCPFGEQYFVDDITGGALHCSPRSRVLQCPDSYSCVLVGDHKGVCCPLAISRIDTVEATALQKFGQCPYLAPQNSDSCEYQCTADDECTESEKCCTNGCGTYCTKPLIMTACQHHKQVSEHQARERNIPPNQIFIPRCDNNQGHYEPVQCDPRSDTCWCVDLEGAELEGTRTRGGSPVNCEAPRICPAIECHSRCPYGNLMTADGCPTCDCRDPCEGLKCDKGMECRMTKVNCISEPCPEMAVCQRKLDNLCEIGEPLLDLTTGHQVICGPGRTSCPSSHVCHLSPFGEFSVCCQKPYEVCMLEKDPGPCRAAFPRWTFNPDTNTCEKFMWGGCEGNLNNFRTRDECISVCPVLTPCQEMRINNLLHASNYDHITFIPRCDKETGAWEPVQCQDEVGICWCVDSAGGSIPGTIQRGGFPQCGTRTGRKLGFDEKVCPDGVTVHLCNSSMCDQRTCMSHPDARCQVNPCGGCTPSFYSRYNREVDCHEGLTSCQSRMQEVINSRAWANRGHVADDIDLPDKYVDSNGILGPTFEVDIGLLLAPSAEDYNKEETLDSPSGLVSSMMSESFHMDGQPGPFNFRATGVKPGLCPAPHLPTLLEVLTRDCDDSCHVDTDCPDSLKCCVGDCGFSCTSPIVVSQHLIPRPGQCPPLPRDLGSHRCDSQPDCMFDTDCPTQQKCCFVGCSSACRDPIDPNYRPVTMVAAPPQCEISGRYQTHQSQSGLSWCVDERGEPLHHTLTRGFLRCDEQGVIIERRDDGPVCPDSSVEPRVCDRACLEARCTAHPDAMCVADPCDYCRVKFYSSSGEEVDCNPRCQQPISRGVCRAAFPRYFYNTSSALCETFTYGGCGGNDNNFETLEECKRACSFPVDLCSLPQQIGVCRARLLRWYYNSDAHRCEMFYYGGCGGNQNNFESREACENRCPDSVVCPIVKPFEFLDICSRSVACSSRPCHSRPDAICKVEPCSCTPTYRDRLGNAVDCRLPETTPAPAPHGSTVELARSVGLDVEPLPSHELNGTVESSTPKEILSRCLLLQQQSVELDAQYAPICDSFGRFEPTQCYQSDDDSPKVCWCVDDAGNQLIGTNSFLVGEKKCDFVPIKSVSVTLGFPGTDMLKTRPQVDTIRRHMEHLLHEMTAVTDNTVDVVLLPDTTQVKFTLLGDNKLDLSYHLEEMVKENHLELDLGDEKFPADLRASWFHHEVETPLHRTSATGSTREIVIETGHIEAPYLAVIVIFLVLTVVAVCVLVIGVVLYRKRTTGQYPKGPDGSLAFSSPVLGYDDRRWTLQKHYDMINKHSIDYDEKYLSK